MISFAEAPPPEDQIGIQCIALLCVAASERYRDAHDLGLGDFLKMSVDNPAKTITVEGGGKPAAAYTFEELTS